MASAEDRKSDVDQQRNWMVCIPREITADIASRLPIKSLTNFRFVCKTWKSLSQDPLLVASYNSGALNRDPCLILHRNYPPESELYFAEFSGQEDDEMVVRKLQNPMNMPIFDVVGSCNGLLCLLNYSVTGDELCIYNPFTRDCKALPRLSMPQKHEGLFGFGFHSSTKEFKVVKIGYPRISLSLRSHRADSLKSPSSEVHILTLNGSKIWRNIGEVPNYQLAKRPGVFINGRIHWLSEWCYGMKDRIIVSFDLSDELFKEVPKPNLHDGRRWYNCQLLLLRGRLATAVFVPSNESCSFDIWIMEEYGVEESWVKKFTIRDYLQQIMGADYRLSMQLRKDFCRGSLVKVLSLLKNGEILLEFKGETLVSYNPERGMCKILTFQGIPSHFQTIVHMGTLNRIDIP